MCQVHAAAARLDKFFNITLANRQCPSTRFDKLLNRTLANDCDGALLVLCPTLKLHLNRTLS